MTDTAPLPKRRLFLVKRKMQLRIIFLVTGAVALAVALIGTDIYLTIGRDIVRDLMDPGLYGVFKHAAAVTVVKMAVYLAVVAFLAMLLSHKMAGPVYRFERSAAAVSGGDLTHRVHLRRGDDMGDLQEAFNAMVESLQKKAAGDAALAGRLSRALEELSKKEGLPPDLLRRLQDLKADAGRLSSGFKV
jgi:methyl-accepting chemotaxis protein